jgi:hypothetical protein
VAAAGTVDAAGVNLTPEGYDNRVSDLLALGRA